MDITGGWQKMAEDAMATARGLDRLLTVATKRIEKLEAEVERLADSAATWEAQAADRLNDWNAMRIRAEAAEAKLRELASAEPVAYQQTDGKYIELSETPLTSADKFNGWTECALICRPEFDK